jgi:hypothetical protein
MYHFLKKNQIFPATILLLFIKEFIFFAAIQKSKSLILTIMTQLIIQTKLLEPFGMTIREIRIKRGH